MDKERQDLLQELIERMMSVMRKVRHDSIPTGPALSPPQAHLLHSITMRKDGATVSELAERMGVTPGAITQFVNGLVEQDLVVRESDPTDRRVVRLNLTPKARVQFEKLRREYLESAAQAYDVLSIKDIRTLNTIFAKIDVPLHKHRDINTEREN